MFVKTNLSFKHLCISLGKKTVRNKSECEEFIAYIYKIH